MDDLIARMKRLLDEGEASRAEAGEPEHLFSRVTIDEEKGVVRVERPLEDGSPWFLYAVYVQVGDQLILAELSVFPGANRYAWELYEGPPQEWPGEDASYGSWSEDPAQLEEDQKTGISARLLRCIRTTDLERTLFSGAALSDLFGEASPDRRRLSQLLRKEPERPGRRGRSDVFYAIWAQRYVETLSTGTPIKTLARKYGRSPTQVRDLIFAARERGLLTDSPPGRAGGSLTESALNALRGREEALGESQEEA